MLYFKINLIAVILFFSGVSSVFVQDTNLNKADVEKISLTSLKKYNIRQNITTPTDNPSTK